MGVPVMPSSELHEQDRSRGGCYWDRLDSPQETKLELTPELHAAEDAALLKFTADKAAEEKAAADKHAAETAMALTEKVQAENAVGNAAEEAARSLAAAHPA